ncbi:hypothetical protein KG091_02585 [Carnobacteriaceae bacterium zg-ZUI78]|nr:hypothetical protein [Carnobacteriaceae bacterium zg-ZUI78]
MNQVTVKNIKEISIALMMTLLLTVIICYVRPELLLPVAMLPFITTVYRYGFSALYGVSILYGVIAGILTSIILKQDMTINIFMFVAASLILCACGFFTKNIHRTVNNRRMKSVWLNIVTATVCSSLAFVGLYYVSMSMNYALISIQSIIYLEVYMLLSVLFSAYQYPILILTKRSPFLSSKERSKLLND